MSAHVASAPRSSYLCIQNQSTCDALESFLQAEAQLWVASHWKSGLNGHTALNRNEEAAKNSVSDMVVSVMHGRRKGRDVCV